MLPYKCHHKQLIHPSHSSPELILPPLAGAADLHHLRPACLHRGAEIAAPVAAGHQLGALVLAAGHVLLLLHGCCQEVSTLTEQIGEATGTFHLDIGCAWLTRRGAAAG